jgi:hypothetical protein
LKTSIKLKDSIGILIVSFPLITILMPTIRIGTIPVRFEDIFIINIVAVMLFYFNIKVKDYIYTLFLLLLTLILIITSSLSIQLLLYDYINLKTYIYGISFIKYVVFAIIILSNSRHIIKLEDIFVRIIKFLLYLQVFVITCQKFDLFGFSNGFFYDFIVRYYAIPSIYATSTDIQQVMSTHMNFAFRPAGIIGSSTITGMVLLVFSYFLYIKTSLTRFKLIGIYVIFVTFSKIAILAFIIIEFIFPFFLENRKNISSKILFLLFFIFLGLIAYNYLGISHNLDGALNGTDRGIWHRLNVIYYVFSQDFVHIFLGNYGKTPSFPFDSGVLLTIFRHGIIFLILEYIILYFILLRLSGIHRIALIFITIIFLSEMTFGSVFNPIFSGIIFCIFLMGFFLKLKEIKNEKNIIHS